MTTVTEAKEQSLEFKQLAFAFLSTVLLLGTAYLIGNQLGLFDQGVNRNTVYYLFMLAIVAASRAFKTHQMAKADSSVTWRNYGHLALDFATAGAGVVTLIIAADQESSGVIVAGYAFFYIVSANFDARSKDFSRNTLFYANLIIAVVFVSTIFYFAQTVLSPKTKVKPVMQNYLVALPYADMSLRQWYSGELGPRTLTYYTEVSAQDNQSAAKLAKQRFWEDPEMVPLHPRVQKSRAVLIIDSDRIVSIPKI